MQDLTPPDTVFVRQQLLKQRVDISDAKQQFEMDAYVDGSPMETPMVTGGAKRSGVSFAGIDDTPTQPAARSGGQIVTDVLLYTNPPLTYLAGSVGLAVLAAVYYALRGGHNLTFLTVLAYVLLADVALNFLRSLVSKQWQDAAGWAGSSWAEAAAERASRAVAAVASLHDTYLLCHEPVLTLKVAAGLWGLAILGQYLSIWSLVTLAFVAAFSLPAAYSKNREAAQAAYASAVRAATSRWEGLGLSRKQKALVLALVLVSLWLRSTWPTRFVALLVGALAVRCHLKPAEVERIAAFAEPYTQSVRKRANRFSTVASEFAMRSVGGKSHVR